MKMNVWACMKNINLMLLGVFGFVYLIYVKMYY